MKYQAAPGLFDLFPEDPQTPWKSSFIWQYVEDLATHLAQNYGFYKICTPICEKTELFTRSVGEDTDIVSKEMYTFLDKGNRSLTLRPEGTAPVIRAFLEKGLEHSLPKKYFYIAPMFRYERSQKGRYRQHHQFGAEAFGIASPEQDVEIIDLAWTFFQKLKLKELTVSINCLGDQSTRQVYRDELKKYFCDRKKELSLESQHRLEVNPLRILDSKQDEDQELLKNAPSILDYLDKESAAAFTAIQEKLTLLHIPFSINPRLVRGLDYYTGVVFEILTQDLGAKSSVGGGGRYDNLVETLGGPKIPAVGFGIGLERTIQTLLNQNIPLPPKNAPLLVLIPLGDAPYNFCFSLLKNLRNKDLAVHMDFRKRSLSKSMQQANQIGAHFVLVLGEDELSSQKIELKDLTNGEKYPLPLDELENFLIGIEK
jgi:histidyl-tRNA synthetase